MPDPADRATSGIFMRASSMIIITDAPAPVALSLVGMSAVLAYATENEPLIASLPTTLLCDGIPRSGTCTVRRPELNDMPRQNAIFAPERAADAVAQDVPVPDCCTQLKTPSIATRTSAMSSYPLDPVEVDHHSPTFNIGIWIGCNFPFLYPVQHNAISQRCRRGFAGVEVIDPHSARRGGLIRFRHRVAHLRQLLAPRRVVARGPAIHLEQAVTPPARLAVPHVRALERRRVVERSQKIHAPFWRGEWLLRMVKVQAHGGDAVRLVRRSE